MVKISDEEFQQMIDYLKLHRDKITGFEIKRDHKTVPAPPGSNAIVWTFIVKIEDPINPGEFHKESG